MNRRELILLLAGAAMSPRRAAGEVAKIFRLGMLMPFPRTASVYRAFADQLQEHGYQEGRNLQIEFLQLAGNEFDRLPAMVAGLVNAAVDVIFCGGPQAIAAAQSMTTIPILGVTEDMVASGFVASLARPGGNTTGVSILASELDEKRQETLMQLVPASRHMAALADAGAISSAQLQVLRDAAATRGVLLSVYSVGNSDEIVPSIVQAHDAGATALNVLASPLLHSSRALILEQCAALRLPAIYQWPETAEEGGLAAYGPNFSAVFRQAARQLAKILQGAKPADIPVDQPDKFELVINLKTAKALALTIRK